MHRILQLRGLAYLQLITVVVTGMTLLLSGSALAATTTNVNSIESALKAGNNHLCLSWTTLKQAKPSSPYAQNTMSACNATTMTQQYVPVQLDGTGAPVSLGSSNNPTKLTSPFAIQVMNSVGSDPNNKTQTPTGFCVGVNAPFGKLNLGFINGPLVQLFRCRSSQSSFARSFQQWKWQGNMLVNTNPNAKDSKGAALCMSVGPEKKLAHLVTCSDANAPAADQTWAAFNTTLPTVTK